MTIIRKTGPQLKTPAPPAGPQLKSGPRLKTPAPVAAPPPPAVRAGPVKKPKGSAPAPTPAPLLNGIRPHVKPDPCDDKTGCHWCPLAPFHKDFADYAGLYGRDASKIQGKVKEPHTVRCRNVSEAWNEVDVLFVGEAPGADEDKEGLPFIGRSGGLLRRSVAEVMNLDPSRVGFANVVRCRPPLNRDPNKTEMKCCTPELIREIKARKPKLIVATGNHSLEFLTGQTGITMLAGKFLVTSHPDIAGIDVLGCFHPAYVLRMDHLLDQFLDTIKLASDFIEGKHVMLPGKGEYFVIDDLARLKQLLAGFKKDGLRDKTKKVAFDTETGSLTPFQSKFPKLLCFSFSNTAGVAYTVPLDHIDSPWCMSGTRAHERPHVIKALQDFFTDPTIRKRAQNEKFDRQHIRAVLGVELCVTDSDTMCKHLTVDERRGTHGLKSLAYSATGMGGYERELEIYIDRHPACDPEKGGSYANIPGALLFMYAAMDADVTVRVDEWLDNTPEYKGNLKFQRLADCYFPQLSAVLAKMEFAGAQVNPTIVEILDAKYSKEMEAAQNKVASFPEVKEYVTRMRLEKGDDFEFNPGSKKQLETVLFDLCGLRPTELTDTGFDIMAARYKRLNEEAKAAKKPAVQFSAVLKQAIIDRKWEFFTTNAEALHEFERQKGKGADLASAILEYRAAQTLHSNFVVPLKTKLDDMGRVHGNFSIIGTVTGRLASYDPNLQNIPNKGGALIKQAYISRFGAKGVIVNVDFSQIELRIAAAWFNEPKMKEVYLKKKDLHLLTAAVIAGLTMEQFKKLPKDDGSNRSQKAWRTRAKRVNFGVLYGGGPPALQATLKKDGVFVTLEECQEFIDKFFKAYPALRAGMDKLEADVTRLGYLESFTGRHRRVPEVFSEDRELRARAIRQSINFPIQSGAGDMTLMALVLIDRILTKEGFRSIPILTVHDSIVFDCHEDEAIEVARIAKQVMENLPALSEEILPGLDWSWLDVPVVAECDMGRNWGAMVEFEPDVLMGEAEGDNADTPLIGKNEKGKDDITRKPVTWAEMLEAFTFKEKKAVAA